MRVFQTIAILLIGAAGGIAAPSQSHAGQTDDDRPGMPVPFGSPGAETGSDTIVRDCLDSPTRRCALASALSVIAEERLAIVRVDALLAVAETFAALGQTERAQTTAEMARTAAEDIGISFGIKRKLAELAPIWAMLGRDDRAVELAEGLSDRYLTANTLGRIAVTQARAGRVEAAQSTLGEISVPLLGLKYALEVTGAIARSDAPLEEASALLEARLDTVEDKMFRGLGLAQLAALHARAGQAEKAVNLREQARDLVPYLTITAQRARLLAGLAQIDLALGDRESYDSHVARAATLAGRVKGDFDQLQSLSEVVAALAAGGETASAMELARSVPTLRGRSALVMRLADEPDTEKAVDRLAGHILDSLGEEDARSERDRARLAVATALTRIGDVDRATRIIAAMEQRDTKARGLAVLARAL